MKRIEWKNIPKNVVHALQRMLRGVRAHTEGIKTAVLVLLAVLLVVQGGVLYHRTTDDGSKAKQESTTQQALVDSEAAAFPIRFAVRSENGIYGLEYNASGMQEVFHATADIWAQAWSSAGQPRRATRAEYRKALKNDLMLMEYDGSIPLQLAAGWVGATVSDAWNSVMLGTAVISRDDVGYTVYFRDNSTGKLLCADTTVDDNIFDTAAAQYDANDCKIAADEKNASVSPDTLYFPGGETFEVMSFADYDGTNGLQALLTAFHMDAEAALKSEYTADNTRIFVSGRDTLQLKKTGEALYDGENIQLTAAQNNNRQLQYVQCGYTLAQSALDAIGSGAAPALTNAYFDSKGNYIAVFSMQIGGIPVDNTDTGYFARFTFRGNTMCSAELALRTTQTTGETIAVMPERQVSAALSGAADAVLSLRYVDEPSKNRKEDDSSDELISADGLFGNSGLLGTDSENTADNTDSDTTPNGTNTQDNTQPDLVQDIDDNSNTTDTAGSAFSDNPTFSDALGETNSSSELQTSWYDTSGTAVSPEWYIIRFNQKTDLPQFNAEEIVPVLADFDTMIQEGGAR